MKRIRRGSFFFGRCLHLYSAFILVCVRNAESQYGTPFFASGRQALISGLINETRPPTTFFPYILGIHWQRLTYAVSGPVLLINPEMRACLNVTSNLIKLLSGSWLLKKDLGFVYKGSDEQLCVTTFVICFEDLGFTTQSYIFHFHVS